MCALSLLSTRVRTPVSRPRVSVAWTWIVVNGVLMAVPLATFVPGGRRLGTGGAVARVRGRSSGCVRQLTSHATTTAVTTRAASARLTARSAP